MIDSFENFHCPLPSFDKINAGATRTKQNKTEIVEEAKYLLKKDPPTWPARPGSQEKESLHLHLAILRQQHGLDTPEEGPRAKLQWPSVAININLLFFDRIQLHSCIYVHVSYTISGNTSVIGWDSCVTS